MLAIKLTTPLRLRGGQAAASPCANSSRMRTMSMASMPNVLPLAGDTDPLLRRAYARPPLITELWAVVHADMRRATRVRAVLDFLSEIVAEEADLLEGRRR